MVEVYLILTGLIFVAWIALLVWQARRSTGDDWSTGRPIVPVSLVEGDEAVIVAEERGRVVYANEQARAWFGMDGGAPSLALMAQAIQPADAFLDLFAHSGHAALRLGQRRLEGMSHPIPASGGARMVVILRELSAATSLAATELDPLRALTLQTDLAQTVSVDQVLGPTVDALLRVVEQAVPFDQAEVLLWHAETQTLRVVGRSAKLSATGSLIPPEDQEQVAIPVGEGYSGWIALYRQPLRIDDAPARSDYALRPGQMPFQSFAGIPLLLDDRLVGTLELTRRTPGAYSPGDIALLQAVAGQIVAVVEGARLRTEQAARMHELSGLQHISGAFSQLGDPQQLYAQITQRIAFLANVELCGIMLYDPDEETYRSQAPFYGVPESLVRGHRLEMAPDSDLYEAVMHRPWWYTNDPASPITAALRLDDVQSTIPLRRVAIVPMVIGTRRVGLLLVANKHGALRFNDADIRSLITFGNQAAMVVENARLYDDAQRRSRELGGLQQIAEAIGALRSPEQLYDQITRRVAELMDVELCGVLLYDPHTHVLVSQRPFYGLEDDETVSFYQLPSPPGSVIAELWQDRPMWYCNDLRRDPLVGDTDLVRMAGALGIRQMALAPLVVRGARRGMIQVANKRGGDFSEDDARILSLFAGQAAILIDNAQLYGEMQRRTHQAEGLRVITEFASQTRSLDEMIEQILIALANLYEAGQVAIALVDEARGQLVVEPGNFWGVALDERLAIDLAGPDVAQSALIGRQPVISAAGAKAGSIPAAYQAVARRLGWRDVAQVPLVIRDQVIGELTIANRTDAEPYHDTDIQLLSAIATQVAAMIDRMRLYQSTDELLRARVETLERLGHISRALRQTTEIDRLLDEVIRVALRSTGARSVSVTLLAPAEDWPAPDEPLIERRVGEQDTLPDLAPLERAAITQGDLIAVDDYAASEWAPAPVLARSAVSVPLVIDGAPLGVLHLIGGEPGAFDARAREFAAVLAAETALAVASSRRYQAQLEANHQLRMRADRMDRIFEVGELFRRGASLEELLAEVAESVRESVGFSSVLISLVDEEAGVMRRTAYAGLPRAAFEQLRRVTPPLEQARSLMQPEYQVSHSYFLPAEGSEALIEGLPTLQVVEERMGPGARAWHPDDLLLIPLYGAGGRLLGLMSVDDPRSGRRPDQATVEALEAFAGQAAFSIENFRLIARIQHEAEATRRERDRLAQLHLVASEIQRAADVPARLQVVADGIHQAGWGKVFITLRDERLEPTALIQAGYSPEEAPGLEIEPGKIWRAWIGDLAFHELKLGAGYYLRYDRPWVRQHVYGGQPPVPAEVGPGEWHPEDTLYLTLVGQDQKRIIGIIGMREPVDGRVPTTSSLQPFELFASQAAAAIETTRLYLETVRAAEQEARFNALMEAVAVSMRPEAVIEAIAVGLQQVVPFTRLHVALGDPDAPQLDLWRATIALDGTLSVGREDPLPAPDTALRRAYDERAPRIYTVETGDAESEQLSDLRSWYGDGERSSLIVPMIAGGLPVGALHLGTELTGAPGFADHLTLIQRLANLSAVALDNARHFDDAQQHAVELDAQAQRLALINRVSTRLAETLDSQELYRIVLSELAEALDVPLAGLVLFESETTGRLALSYPLDEPTPDLTLRLADNLSIEHVRATHRPLVSTDVLSDPLFEAAWPVLRQRGTQSLMIVPLLIGDNVIGTIGLDSDRRRAFTDAEVELVQTIAGQASLAVEKARLYDETLGLTIFNQAVVESIRQGIVVLDQDLRVRRVNGYMREHYGWSGDALGQPLFEYRPDYERFLRQPIAVVLERGEPQAQYEIERDGGNGRRSIRNYYVYPMREGRTVTGIVLLVEDITERALLEADLSSRAMQMAALSEVSSQITSTLEADQVVQLILDALDRVIPYDGVSLWLRSPEREELAIVAARGYRDPDLPDATELVGLRVEIAHSPLFREMAERAEVINAGDVSAGDRRFPYGAAAVYKNWLGAPLISKGRVAGVLTLEKREPHYYTAVHEQLALTFASQAAVALDNAQLFEETRARATALDEQAQRLALLNRVSLALAQSLDMENILEIALRETAIALDVAEGSAMQIDHPGQMGRVVVDYPRGDLPPDKALDLADNPVFERVRDSLIPLVIENIAADPHREELRVMMRRDDISSTMLVPLVIGGIVIGVLRLDSVEPRQFSLAQIELAQTIASQAAIAVQNASLFEQSSIRTRELETLFESAQATAVTLDLDEVARRVAEQVLGALRADAASVFLWDEVNNWLELRGTAHAESEGVSPVPLGERFNVRAYPLRGRALRERRLIVARASDPDLALEEVALFAARGASGRLLLPLVVNEVSIGLVEIETLDAKRFFKSEEMRLARTLASQAAIAIENARLQTETRRTVEELYIINDLSAALSSATRLDELLAVLDVQLPSLMRAEAIYVALYDAATDTLTFPLATAVQAQGPERRALDLAPRPLGSDEFSMIVRRQTPLLLAGDQIAAARSNLGIETILLSEAQSFAGVPLFAGEQVIGALAVGDNDPLAFSSDDQRLLTTVGSQLGVAIQSARLLQQTRDLAEDLEQRVEDRTAELVQERQQLSTLYQITTGLATGLDIERLLSRALEMVAEATGASEGAIFALDPAGDRLALRAQTGAPLSASADEASSALALREGLARWTIQQRQNVIVDDVPGDSRWRFAGAGDEAPRSALVALIEAAEEILGVMLLGSAQPSAFTVDHLRLVVASTSQIANAINNAELYSLIRDQAERLGAMLRQEQVEATKSSAILDSVADGVMVADQHGQVIGFNSTAERILGIPGSRVLGRPTSIVAGLYSSGGRWLNTVNRWLKQPHDYQPGEFLEERLSLEDGRVISVRLSPVYLGEQFLGTVSIFRDITRDVEVDRLKSEFVATVSHELRTPMTSIKGYADLLLLGAAGEVSEQQQYFLDVIKQNADRLSTLVNDLLDISRIDQQRVVLQLEQVAAGDVLREALEHLRERVEDRKREMTLALDLPEAADLTLWGDARKLAQIMANLADNAFNYTPPGGTIRLGARPRPDTNTVILSVADTGIGIPPEMGDRVFERFFRGDEAQELVMDTPGTGLGLSIVKEYVEMLHGSIWYKSDPGRGTTFYVELPATGAAPQGARTPETGNATGRETENELERGVETGPLSRE